MLGTGQTAPDFTLPACPEGPFTLSAQRPAPVVLFFYGKDGTPTCTAEAMEFAALLPEFSALGARVIGISKDSLAAHARFAARSGIGYTLGSDQGGRMMEDWGAFGEKLFFGKQVQGVLRRTYLIDGSGEIAGAWVVERVKGHAAEVLAALRRL
ncbi:MAG: peroxiredoxin [Paracoccaceae bacterium]